jgi:hypothetical protein
VRVRDGTNGPIRMARRLWDAARLRLTLEVNGSSQEMAMKPDVVVVGTDGSDPSFRAVEWAASEAVMRGAT